MRKVLLSTHTHTPTHKSEHNKTIQNEQQTRQTHTKKKTRCEQWIAYSPQVCCTLLVAHCWNRQICSLSNFLQPLQCIAGMHNVHANKTPDVASEGLFYTASLVLAMKTESHLFGKWTFCFEYRYLYGKVVVVVFLSCNFQLFKTIMAQLYITSFFHTVQFPTIPVQKKVFVCLDLIFGLYIPE